jgi:copper oxidase (laccase) domain-containing protein
MLLENIGLKKDNIVDSNICSVCNSNYVDSYRVQGITTQEGTAIISLKKTSL